MKRKIFLPDSIVHVLLFVGVFGGFIYLSTLNVIRGPSSADDAWIALSAKNIAAGLGYSTSISSTESVLFDPHISTGPTLVLPVALQIYIFGPTVWIPGAVQLFIFNVQLGIFAAIVARYVGWRASLNYIAVLLIFITLASANNWYFGALLGEPVAFAFLLMGTALLAVEIKGRVVLAAICFSLAFLTKQISGFAVAGIVFSWIIVSIYEHTSLLTILRRLTILILVGLSLPITFEAIKLATLGFEGYLVSTKKILDSVSSQTLSLGNVGDRWTRFLSIVHQSYMPLALVVGLAIGSAFLFLLFRYRIPKMNAVLRFAAFAWVGSAVYFGYIILFSNLWTRYLWIGIAIALAAVAAPLLLLEIRGRFTVIFLLLVGIISSGFYSQLQALYTYISTSTVYQERSTVIQILNDHPEVPYASQYWSSIYDVVYLREFEGKWAFGPGVNSLRGKEFIAIVNHVFTDKNSPFFVEVSGTCKLLTHGAKRLEAYYCDAHFWASYPSHI